MRPGGLRKRPESPLGGLMALLERSRCDFGPFHDGPETPPKRSSKNEDIYPPIFGLLLAPFRSFSINK